MTTFLFRAGCGLRACGCRGAVIARKGDGRWFIAGINGEPVGKTVTLDLRELPAATSGRLITDGEGGAFTGETVTLTPGRKLTVTLKPNGGFVLVLPVH